MRRCGAELAWAAGLSVAVALAVPGGAAAATVVADPHDPDAGGAPGITLAATPGTRDDVELVPDGDTLVVRRVGGIEAGGQCVQLDAGAARCPWTNETLAQVVLGDLNDRLVVRGALPRLAAYGNEGDDVLEGGEGGVELYGNEGADRILAGAGDDTLVGGPGDDVLAAGAGKDTANGFAGDDRIDAGAGNDVVDRQPFEPDPAAAAGVDEIDARDGDIDRVGCGGPDRVLLDAVDEEPAPCGRGARVRRGDTVSRARFGATPVGSRPVATRRWGSSGRWSVRLRCPAAAGAGGCAGFAVSGPSRAAFRVSAGRTRPVRLVLDVYETVRGRRVRHVAPLIVLTRDARGRTRTVRRPLFLLAR